MVEFIFTVRDDPPEDGYSLGDLEVLGNLGSVTTRGLEHSDQRMMVYPSAAALLSEARLLASRGKGNGRFEGFGSMFVVEFSLQKDRVATRHGKMVIDSTPLSELLCAVYDSAKSLHDHGVSTIKENRKVLNMLEKEIDSFEVWRASLDVKPVKSNNRRNR
ncbi:hypothetical protein ACFWPX_31510 [Nocardia sp. NPDC058518]|uniref:hypothetical protein n=1 Tax=Nocardia sp. NPDC058518 TaxID=3346534 RepID=UPI003667C522